VGDQSNHYDVIILGAGAAGLFCAITAASRGRRVVVLEKANKVGKKILMSGGGRCNFTNYGIEADNYISANPHFCKAALNRYTQWDFITLVEKHQIEYEERKHGQLFCKNSARDILDMLLLECAGGDVDIRTHCDIDTVVSLAAATANAPEQHGGTAARYRVEFTRNHQRAAIDGESVVVATGALSIPTLGGSGMGYDIAGQFGLPITARQAGLVPFMFTDTMKTLCERLSGISLPVEINCNGRIFAEDLLFTHRGISGPVVLQISNYWHPGEQISVNLLPELDAIKWLQQARAEQGRMRLRTLLNQKLTRALAGELQALWWPQHADAPLAGFSDKQLATIGQLLNAWQLKPSATEGYRTAEVTLGGVDTNSLSSKTMEAKQHPGLFFIGEVLDVTGHLGGFNFQWAWSSGYSAGLFV
jgi:predicted Rossmann fold flavoprotein